MKDLASTLTAKEIEDLKDLLSHPGWHLMETMVDREWGATGFGQKIAATVGQMASAPNDLAQMQLAAQHLAQATVTQAEIHRVMKWPRDQVNKAKQLALGSVASMNRGGL